MKIVRGGVTVQDSIYCPTWSAAEYNWWRQLLIDCGLPKKLFKHKPRTRVIYFQGDTVICSPETFAHIIGQTDVG